MSFLGVLVFDWLWALSEEFNFEWILSFSSGCKPCQSYGQCECHLSWWSQLILFISPDNLCSSIAIELCRIVAFCTTIYLQVVSVEEIGYKLSGKKFIYWGSKCVILLSSFFSSFFGGGEGGVWDFNSNFPEIQLCLKSIRPEIVAFVVADAPGM